MAYTLDKHTLLDGSEPVLSGIESQLTLEEDRKGVGTFLRIQRDQSAPRIRFPLGRVFGLERYTACHRYEPYWMKAHAGSDLSEVAAETQFLLARVDGDKWLILVPLVDEPFRFSLQGRSDGRLDLLAETGDAFLPAFGGRALFVARGDNPFTLARRGAEAVSLRLGGGALRRNKSLPAFVDQFGWCTWDAFYQDVSADKLREGLASFKEGGVSPKMLILDDGWQTNRQTATGERRLTSFDANTKFPGGLANSVRMAKDEFRIEAFLVWHAVSGYWGGVDGDALPGYEVVDQSRHFGEGIMTHKPTFDHDCWGSLVGLVPARNIAAFYDDYHSALAEQGVDGVKVDSQAVLEGLAEKQGGRVALCRTYREALDSSTQRHFAGRLINCMSNHQECWYFATSSTLLRTSMDFLPSKPESHGDHLYANAQVGVWFGEFMHPDWDMFQSGHEWGAFHAAARAVSGSPVYVSDKPDAHDFSLLKKLVLSDGSVLRCDQPGLPTRDCLCRDPTREDILFKIWNRNGAAGVVGVFNCHYAPTEALPLTGTVSPRDVEGLGVGRFACYAHNARTLELLEASDQKTVTCAVGNFEIMSFVPIERDFAAIGLTGKFNSNKAVQAVTWRDEVTVEVSIRDGGSFVAYSSRAPGGVECGAKQLPFNFDPATGRLALTVPGTAQQMITIRW